MQVHDEPVLVLIAPTRDRHIAAAILRTLFRRSSSPYKGSQPERKFLGELVIERVLIALRGNRNLTGPPSVDLVVVAELLGHARLDTTRRLQLAHRHRPRRRARQTPRRSLTEGGVGTASVSCLSYLTGRATV